MNRTKVILSIFLMLFLLLAGLVLPSFWKSQKKEASGNKGRELADQVITLVAANKRLLLDVETAKTKEFQLGMLDFFHTEHMEIVNELNEKKVLDDTITEQIVEAVKEYKSR